MKMPLKSLNLEFIKNLAESAENTELEEPDFEENPPANKYQKAKTKKENKLKNTRKSLKKTLKPFLKKETITKIIIIFSSIALLATSVLPFILQ